jgi:uncharacterized membrane protein YfcA
MIEQILLSPYFVALVFFSVALLYSSVGLGGGSSYTALMAISGISFMAIPIVSLSLNLIVTTAGSFNFIRNGHAKFNIVAPFLISSIPMAYAGGLIEVSPEFFYWVLLFSLLFVAVRIYFWQSISFSIALSQSGKVVVSLIAGSVLGLIAGIVGIGGGIFLVPLVIMLGLGTEKQAAACAAILVWLNSASGLASRIQHNSVDMTDYLILIGAVLAGGLIGSFMGSFRLQPRTMEKILGIVVIVAIAFLLRKLVF